MREETDGHDGQHLTRNLTELLGELRIALPGVQVLFAFLLAVPFQARFATVTRFQRDVYFATLCCAFVASACLIAPTAFHRITFHMHQRPALVSFANRLALAGLAALALAMTGVMLLIADVLFGKDAALAAAALAALLLVVLWAALPLSQRHVKR
jgi:hypothetical protein